VIVRNMPLEAEAVEQRLLHHVRPSSTESPPPQQKRISAPHRDQEVFQHRVMGGSSST
jgi:hypothetical protein